MKGLKGKDMEIAQRLKRLQEGDKGKSDTKTLPSADEIASRLAKNQGRSEENSNKPHVWKKDTRTQQEQVDALLDEINDEVELDARFLPPTDEIQKRLDSLKSEQTTTTHKESQIGTSESSNPEEPIKRHSGNDVEDLIKNVAFELQMDSTKSMDNLKKDKSLFQRLRQLIRRKSNTKSDNEARGNQLPKEGNVQPKLSTEEESPEDEERLEARKIVRQLLEEAKLEEMENLGFSGAQSNVPDELPYCCLCNEDAKYKCIDCEDDLFCSRCLKTVHNKEPDYKEHRSVDFRPPKRERK
ncbi:DgyrCDS8350 [Dimorphilus gyrociliatus]|uniref:DgyrCDS8350 n=1 Tax=Dimorphilus gyrociliatus TaxID=2664684 RepID=A0A7I8VVF9_9ANNE|nr:DgyrCDS8350 [Dimorphilus gyrociliatus]